MYIIFSKEKNLFLQNILNLQIVYNKQ